MLVEIPDIWLAGRAGHHEREGMSPWGRLARGNRGLDAPGRDAGGVGAETRA